MDKDLLTTRQLQELLQVDRTTVYRMLADGRLHGFKVGGQWRFSRASIEAWLEEHESVGVKLLQDQETITSNTTNPLPIGCLQPIQDIFAIAAGVGAVITRTDGTPMTNVSNSCRFCDVIMSSSAGKDACIESWRRLASHKNRKPSFQTCHAGLTYVRGLVEVESDVVAAVFVGQLSDGVKETIGEKVPGLARKYSLDEDTLLSAVYTIYVLDEITDGTRLVELLQMVSDTLSEMGRERMSLLGKLHRIAEITASK